MAGSHKDLRVWQQSMEFCVSVYQATGGFPDSEKFGLRSQLRRAAVSIPSNIAEGAARDSSADYAHFLTIAIASASEVDTHWKSVVVWTFYRTQLQTSSSTKSTRSAAC